MFRKITVFVWERKYYSPGWKVIAVGWKVKFSSLGMKILLFIPLQLLFILLSSIFSPKQIQLFSETNINIIIINIISNFFSIVAICCQCFTPQYSIYSTWMYCMGLFGRENWLCLWMEDQFWDENQFQSNLVITSGKKWNFSHSLCSWLKFHFFPLVITQLDWN